MVVRLKCRRLCVKLLNIMTLLSVITMCYFILVDPASKIENRQEENHDTVKKEFVVKSFKRQMKELNQVKLTESSEYKEKYDFNEKVFLIIGISTVCRHRSNYLKATIDSLLNNTSAEDKMEMRIVVSVSDLNTSCSDYVTWQVQQLYKSHVLNGFLNVIRIPKSYYPSFDNLKRTFNDSKERVRWRSQQNLDYSFLMKYIHTHRKSLFYLHLEDDVISAPGYFKKIKLYIQEVKDNWAVLEFSSLGFIGKLFHSEDLEKISSLLRVYFSKMPCDFLLFEFLKLMLQDKRYIKIPTLFQHQGLHSSMPHLERNVSDKLFFIAKKDLKGDNPPASVSTSLRIFSDFKAEFAYLNSEEKYLWAQTPKVGDTITVKFKIPQKLDRIIVESGFPVTKQDKIRGAILHVSGALDNPSKENNVCVQYVFVDEFKDGRIDVKNLSKSVTKPVSCIRIMITEEQSDWIVIREIAVYVGK